MNTEITISLILFILGASLGSFLSVVISRLLKHQKGIFFGRSACPHCHHQLSASNLIPIISWLVQKGRCAYCHKDISIYYPTLEICSGLLLLISFNSVNYTFLTDSQILNSGFNWLKISYLEILNLLLLAISFSDLQTKKIPNIFIVLWLIFALPGFYLQSWISVLIALAINLAFFGGQWLISRGKWLGLGDLYLSIGMALLLGWEKNLLAIVLSYLIGSLIAIPLLLLKKAHRRSTLAFGPFLLLGTLISLYFGQSIINWYIGSLNF